MAISEKEFQQMQKDIRDIKRQLARREQAKTTRAKTSVQPRKSHARSEGERVDEILHAAGLLAELTPEEKATAAEWRALPEEEKLRVREELWNLRLEKPLSQIIIENR
jgi:hypothetical protein